MTTETKKELTLENLLESQQYEFASEAANKTIQYIRNEISTLESLRSTALKKRFQSELGQRMAKVIDTNFLTPGFYSDYSHVQKDEFLKRAVYLEKVLSELTVLTEKYKKDALNENLFNALEVQRVKMLGYLMMTDSKEFTLGKHKNENIRLSKLDWE